MSQNFEDAWEQYKELEGLSSMPDEEIPFIKRAFHAGALAAMRLDDEFGDQAECEDEFANLRTQMYHDAFDGMQKLGGFPQSLKVH
jgi:hypothetical protein